MSKVGILIVMGKDFVLFLGGDAIIFIAKVRIFRAEVRRFSARIFGTDIWRYKVGILILSGVILICQG